MAYQLNVRIEKDSEHITHLKLSELRLIKDGELDWFILIPKKENLKEITDLSMDDQVQLLKEINIVTETLNNHSQFSKLNIASLGNIVSQLHIHIIARKVNDRAWPNAIWSTKSKNNFKNDKIQFWKNHF